MSKIVYKGKTITAYTENELAKLCEVDWSTVHYWLKHSNHMETHGPQFEFHMGKRTFRLWTEAGVTRFRQAYGK